MKKLLNKKGFTLIELIVVIAIIAILAAILIPALIEYIEQANITRHQSDARSLYTKSALDVATMDSTASGADVAVPDNDTGMTCDYTYASNAITAFECTATVGGEDYSFSLAGNFAATLVP